MYGYIYSTLNLINGEIYIGKKKSNKFLKNYYGSGKIICENVKLYGKEIYHISLIDKAENKEELDFLEKKYIKKYKDRFGENCINIAEGGTGNNALMYASKDEKDKFKKQMRKINKSRTQSNEYKKQCSERMKKRYQDSNERKKQSVIIKEAWSNEVLREEQSKRLKKYYETHKKDNSFNNKKCVMQLNEKIYNFISVKELRNYLKNKYDYNPDNRTFRKIVENSKEGIPYKPFHKNNKKLNKLNGMLIFIE